MKTHKWSIRPAKWMEDTDYVYNLCNEHRVSRYIIGMDEDGDIFVPLSWAHPDEQYTPFNRWIPLHWIAYLNSWCKKEIATLETSYGYWGDRGGWWGQ